MEMVMVEPFGDYWPLILVAVVILAILAFLLLRPKQRVRLSDSTTPLRPHMQAPRTATEGRGLAGEAAAAASDVTGELLRAPVHRTLAGEPVRDDFKRMKGVGPKLAEALHAQGFASFEQLARLTPSEVERLDGQLGPFRGRLHRDRIVEQADYLARGDLEGFEARFGKLTT
jgi:predicted flap endonuclease-1-like 5' DNA nuclease